MRVLMTDDEKFVHPESGEEILPARLIGRIRRGEDLTVESRETGEDVTREALMKILRSPGTLENILNEVGGVLGELGEEVTSGVGSLERSVKDWFDRMVEEGKLSPEQAPEWYKKIDEGTRDSLQEVEERITEVVRKTLDRLEVPRGEKIEDLEERISRLERSVKFPHDEV